MEGEEGGDYIEGRALDQHILVRQGSTHGRYLHHMRKMTTKEGTVLQKIVVKIEQQNKLRN